MGKRENPRHGSMQFWPRKRAARSYARIRNVAEEKLPIFAGYKVGMTHVIATDSYKNSLTKGEDIAIPVTIIECPPLKIFGARTYKEVGYGTGPEKTLFFFNDKNSERLYPKLKISKIEEINKLEGKITLIVMTQPPFKKTPEVFEIPFHGTNEELAELVKNKEIKLQDVYKEGDYFDARAITKGKGFQGPVKRFGVNIRSHKSEKSIRNPGSLGSWKGQQHMMYRVAHAGQMGYHQRTQYNNQILKISDKPEEVNPKGGLIRYGNVKSTFLLVKGSMPGAKKRLISLTKPLRLHAYKTAPTVQEIGRAQ